MFLSIIQMKKNVLNVDFHVSRYGRIVEELRKEVSEKIAFVNGHSGQWGETWMIFFEGWHVFCI